MQNCSELIIDLNAIQKNLTALSRPGIRIMPMVKANGYGTHALLLTQFLEKQGCSIVGVSHVQEAVYLRDQGITLPIFVISAPQYEAELVARYALEVALSTEEEARTLNHFAEIYGTRISVHLHVNTGMNRFGATPEETQALALTISSLSSLHLVGVMTHFVAAESLTFDPFTHTQISVFHEVIQQLPCKPRWIHAANSGGIHRFSLPFCNLARIGIGLFGYGSPTLHPALSLYSHLVAIHTCKKGESVGYDQTHTIDTEGARIGVIPIGYHDGFHRHYSGKGYVLIHSKKAWMVGRICMDFMMVDISEIPEAKIGDRVTFFDAHLSADTVAHWGKTDVRELIACLGPRIKRSFVYENSLSEKLSNSLQTLQENTPSR